MYTFNDNTDQNSNIAIYDEKQNNLKLSSQTVLLSGNNIITNQVIREKYSQGNFQMKVISLQQLVSTAK